MKWPVLVSFFFCERFPKQLSLNKFIVSLSLSFSLSPLSLALFFGGRNDSHLQNRVSQRCKEIKGREREGESERGCGLMPGTVLRERRALWKP